MERHRRGNVFAIVIATTAISFALIRLQSLPWLQIAWSDLPGWVSRSSPEAITAALLIRGAAPAVIALSISALGGLADELSCRLSDLRRAASRVSAVMRGLTQRMAVGAITMSSLTPQLAAAQEYPAAPAVIEPIDRSVSAGFVPFSAAGSPELATMVVVRPGDTLWAIAASHLRTALGREPSATEITRHWRDLIDLNTDRLRSGDPDLIQPGEEILLPQVHG